MSISPENFIFNDGENTSKNVKLTEMANVRTRFAPSPTGYLHIGGLRTALYAYAQAKSQKGAFILRIEDTDRKRYVEDAVDKLIKTLKIFNLNWDEGPVIGGPYSPYVQSERVKTGLYEKYAKILVDQGNAFYCFCEGSEGEIERDHTNNKPNLRDVCRNLTLDQINKKIYQGKKPAIRLKVPENETITYFDTIRNKEISWKSEFVDDAMLLKSDGFPAYHLSVVVDDSLMKITHISRAHEWLPSTPIHLLLYKYLGFTPPKIGHFTAILDPAGGKLSKRKSSVSCEDFLSRGYLPEAILNFIMLLGWAPKDNRELFSLDEFVKEFPAGSLQVSNPVFNIKKLDWFNGQYIRSYSSRKLKSLIFDYYKGKYKEEIIEKLIPLVQSRITTLNDFGLMTKFIFKEYKVDKSLYNKDWKKNLESAFTAVSTISKWDKVTLDRVFMEVVNKNKFSTGDFFMNLRVALSGSRFTPPITESILILGKKEVMKRLKKEVNL